MRIFLIFLLFIPVLRTAGEISEEKDERRGVSEASLAGGGKTSCSVCQDTPQAGDTEDEKVCL